MSNFRALGFTVESAEDLEALARAPRKLGEGQMRLHDGASLMVYRHEVGGGIELWAVEQDGAFVAAYPTFMAQATRPGVVESLGYRGNVFTPRLRLESGPSFQLVNYLFMPEDALTAGTRVAVALSGLGIQGFRPTADPDAPQGLRPPNPDKAPAKLPENLYWLRGTLAETEVFANALTTQPVRRLVVEADGQRVEAACHAEDAPEDLQPGDPVEGAVTLRGAVVEILQPVG